MLRALMLVCCNTRASINVDTAVQTASHVNVTLRSHYLGSWVLRTLRRRTAQIFAVQHSAQHTHACTPRKWLPGHQHHRSRGQPPGHAHSLSRRGLQPNKSQPIQHQSYSLPACILHLDRVSASPTWYKATCSSAPKPPPTFRLCFRMIKSAALTVGLLAVSNKALAQQIFSSEAAVGQSAEFSGEAGSDPNAINSAAAEVNGGDAAVLERQELIPVTSLPRTCECTIVTDPPVRPPVNSDLE